MHALLGLAAWIGIATLLGYIGRDRKFGFWGNFAVTLLLSPVVGIIVYFAQSKQHSDDRSHKANEVAVSSEATA